MFCAKYNGKEKKNLISMSNDFFSFFLEMIQLTKTF